MKLWLASLLLISGSAYAETQWIEFPINTSASSSYSNSTVGNYSYDVPCMYFKVSSMNVRDWDGIGFCNGKLCNEYHGITDKEAYFGPFNGPTSITLLKSGRNVTSFNLASVMLGLDESGQCDAPPFAVATNLTPFSLPSHSTEWAGVQYQLTREPTTRCSGRTEGTFAVDADGKKVDLAGCILEDAVALNFQGRPLIFGRGTDNSIQFRDFQVSWTQLGAKATEFVPAMQGSNLVLFGLNPGQSVIMRNFSFGIWNSIPLVCQSGLSVATNGKNGYLVSCTTPDGTVETTEVR